MARSAVYSLISLGVKRIFVCNRTLDHAVALADHYNELIRMNAIPELATENDARPHIQVLESFTSPWPGNVRHPTLIVSGIPRQEPGHPPTNFSLPDDWMKSPTGGVVLEVSNARSDIDDMN